MTEKNKIVWGLHIKTNKLKTKFDNFFLKCVFAYIMERNFNFKKLSNGRKKTYSFYNYKF